MNVQFDIMNFYVLRKNNPDTKLSFKRVKGMLLYKIAVIAGTLTIILLLFFSLKLARRSLHPLEILAYYMAMLLFRQQTYNIITMNLRLIESSQQLYSLVPVKMGGTVIFPVCGIWVMAAFFSKKMSIVWKTGMVFAYLVITSLYRFMRLQLGYVPENNWSTLYDLVATITFLFLLFVFSLYFRKLLRERRILP